MKRRKKRLMILLIVALIAVLLGGYIRFFNGSLVYFTTGLKKSELMKLDDRVTYTFEAKLLMSDARSEYESMFGETIWEENIGDNTFEEYIMDQIKTKLMRVRAMNELASERGVVLGREEKEAVKDAVDRFYDGLTASQIDELDVTKEKLTEMFTDFAVANKLYEDLTSIMDIEVSSDEARVINIQYIVTDSQEQAEEALKLVQEGASFFAVAKEYNEDGQYEYELKRGEMEEEFEEVAFELSTGQMSDIVESNDRYYIIRCTSDNDKAKTEVNKVAILEKKKLEQFNKDFEFFESNLYIEFNDKEWSRLKLSECTVFDIRFEDLINSCV